MSLIRTDYVPEWRISAHAQSVLAAGQKHHKYTVYNKHKCHVMEFFLQSLQVQCFCMSIRALVLLLMIWRPLKRLEVEHVAKCAR